MNGEIRSGIKSQPVPEANKEAGSRFVGILVIGFLIFIILTNQLTRPAKTFNPDGMSPYWAFFFGFLTSIGLVLLFVFWSLKRKKAKLGDFQGASWLIDMGRVAEGNAQIDNLLERLPKNDSNSERQWLLTNKARVHILAGEIQEAIAIYDRLLKSDMTADVLNQQVTVRISRAGCYALLGKCAEAESDLKCVDGQTDLSQQCNMLSARCVIELRSGRIQNAIDILAQEWLEVEGILPGKYMKRLRILRAFALSQLQKKDESNRELATIYPIRINEFDFLAKNWPELKSFLEENKVHEAAS